MTDEKSIYRRALNLWGENAQIGMAIEECAELIQAIMKRNRHHNGTTDADIIEEIADVEIMLSQLRVIYGDDKVETIKQMKLARLLQLVKYGEGTA